MSNVTCKKGFILSNNGDGDYTPFFVQVREKDIIWDERLYKNDLVDIANTGSNKQFYPTMAYWKFDKDDWKITLRGDGYFTASKKLTLNDFTAPSEPSEYLFSKTISLPFSVIDDSEFRLHFEKRTIQYSLELANALLRINKYDSKGGVERISITLATDMSSPFLPDIKENSASSKTSFNMILEGNINI